MSRLWKTCAHLRSGERARCDDVEDFGWMENGSGRVLIRRSKTDQVGEGSLAY